MVKKISLVLTLLPILVVHVGLTCNVQTVPAVRIMECNAVPQWRTTAQLRELEDRKDVLEYQPTTGLCLQPVFHVFGIQAELTVHGLLGDLTARLPRNLLAA